jgi:hypothetical protein
MYAPGREYVDHPHAAGCLPVKVIIAEDDYVPFFDQALRWLQARCQRLQDRKDSTTVL